MAGDPLGPAIVKGESEVLLPWFWVRKGHREATSPVQGSGHRSRGMAHSPRWQMSPCPWCFLYLCTLDAPGSPAGLLVEEVSWGPPSFPKPCEAALGPGSVPVLAGTGAQSRPLLLACTPPPRAAGLCKAVSVRLLSQLGLD